MLIRKKATTAIPGDGQKGKFPLFAVLIILLSIALLFGLSRFVYNEDDESLSAMTADFSGMDAQAVLDAIYADNQVKELEAPSPRLLDEQYGLSTDMYVDIYAQQSSGRYGVADVFIVLPVYGHEDEVREALEQIKNSRIVEFSNYDVYSALEYAEDGQIFEVGGHICLVMIENADEARAIIESALGGG